MSYFKRVFFVLAGIVLFSSTPLATIQAQTISPYGGYSSYYGSSYPYNYYNPYQTGTYNYYNTTPYSSYPYTAPAYATYSYTNPYASYTYGSSQYYSAAPNGYWGYCYETVAQSYGPSYQYPCFYPYQSYGNTYYNNTGGYSSYYPYLMQ